MGRLWRILVLAAIVGIVVAARWAGRRVPGPAEQPAASATAAQGLDALKARLLERARGMAAGPGARGEAGRRSGAALAGRVVRAGTGEAVPGAEVKAAWGRGGWEPGDSLVAQADGEGRFRFEGLPPRRYRLGAVAEGFWGSSPDDVLLREGEEGAEITIAVHPAAVLRGRLEKAETSEPCPDGEVSLFSPTTGFESAKADGAGSLIFRALLPGHYTVNLSCPDVADDEAGSPIDVGEAPLAMTFVVHPQHAIKGTLVNEEGVPDTMEASVRARRVGDDEEGDDASASPDDDGRFVMLGVGVGTYEVSAWGHEGTISVQPAVVTVREGEPAPEVRLVVRTRHRISGRVVDERGLPVAGASLEAATVYEAWQSPALREPWSALADDDGRFEIEGLPAGKLHFTIELGGAPLPVVGGVEEAAVPGDDAITLVARLPAGRIEGRILGAGPAWQGASVQLSGEAGGVTLSQTLGIDEEGRFSALVPPDAEVSLQAVNHEGETAIAENVRPGTPVELPVRAAATLRGRVRDAPRLFRVDLQDNDDRSETFLGTDGAFEMHGVPALPMRVVVIAEGLTTVEQITPDPGGTLSLELTLAPRPEDVDTMPEGDDDGGEEVPGDEAIGEVTEEPEGAGGAD